ncbi:MAG: HAD-IA family hydrolase [Candidatus Nomurabacteria bacterium]|nr:HAD-IA family hydrolase [Candidatus Nomurabacteria bacterium]
MIKVIIFDGVGLITHQEPLSIALERDYGFSMKKMLPFFTGPLQECVAGRAELREIFPQYLNAWGWNKGMDAMLGYWFTRDHKIDKKMVSYIEGLKKKGIQCFLATNQEKNRFAYMLDKMDFAKIFDRTYCSAHLGHKKPSREFFSKIFKDLKDVKKEEILFWDDKAENVKGAKDFGFNAELYTSFENFEKKTKQYLV